MELLQNPTFWVAISTVIFLVAVYKPITGFAFKGLDERKARIESELNEAVRLREEAQVLLAEYQARQRAYTADAERILAQTRSDADAMAKRAEQELQASLERRKQMALQKIEQSEAAAIAAVQAHMVDIAVAAARELLKSDAGKAGEDSFALAVQDIERKLH